MNDLDTLRTGLEEIAAEVTPVDLHARVLASSRRLTVRRTATGVATAIAATVAALAVGISLQPAAAPSPGPSATPLPVAPKPTTLPAYQEGQVPSLGPFLNATINVPTWGAAADAVCPTGQVKLTEGQYVPATGKPPVTVLSWASTDVDGDGTADYVAQLTCGEGPESPGVQIVAFRRSGTRLLPIARVIGTQDGLAMVESFEARGGGQIAVQVAAEYTDSGIQYVPNQWRVYALQGSRFRQVAGPTSFPADPPAAALSVTASPLTFTRAASGYVGDLTVTVANTGALDVAQAELTMLLPVQARPAGDGWTGCAVTYDVEVLALKCPVGELSAGSTRQLHFRFVAVTVPVRGDALIGPDDHDHYVTLAQLPPYVFERTSNAFEATFAVIAP